MIAALVAVLGVVVAEPLGGALIVAEVGGHIALTVGVTHSYREVAGIVVVRGTVGVDLTGGVVVSADLAVISLDLHSVLITLGDDLADVVEAAKLRHPRHRHDRHPGCGALGDRFCFPISDDRNLLVVIV